MLMIEGGTDAAGKRRRLCDGHSELRYKAGGAKGSQAWRHRGINPSFLQMTCGLLIGWRITEGLGSALLGITLLLLFSFAMSWIGAVIALTARSVEVAQSLGLIWLFPVTFISGAFVSIDTLPGPLQMIAAWNPITAVATSVRELFGNAPPAGFVTSTGWAADNAVAPDSSIGGSCACVRSVCSRVCQDH